LRTFLGFPLSFLWVFLRDCSLQEFFHFALRLESRRAQLVSVHISPPLFVGELWINHRIGHLRLLHSKSFFLHQLFNQRAETCLFRWTSAFTADYSTRNRAPILRLWLPATQRSAQPEHAFGVPFLTRGVLRPSVQSNSVIYF